MGCRPCAGQVACAGSCVAAVHHPLQALCRAAVQAFGESCILECQPPSTCHLLVLEIFSTCLSSPHCQHSLLACRPHTVRMSRPCPLPSNHLPPPPPLLAIADEPRQLRWLLWSALSGLRRHNLLRCYGLLLHCTALSCHHFEPDIATADKCQSIVMQAHNRCCRHKAKSISR